MKTQYLLNKIKNKEIVLPEFQCEFTLSVEPVDGAKVLRVDCRPGITPAYVMHQDEEHFYVRTGPAKSRLPASQIHEYIQHRFHGG